MSGEGGPASLPPGLVQALGGRFTLRKLLGRGAMGAVWRAHDAELGREVALKLLSGAGPAEERRARFAREAQIGASLQHPGIARLHGADTAAGVPYLVLELVEGARPLDQVLPALPLRQRVELLRDAARALGHAHARGVTHRDVKPGNLLVDGQGRLKVVDFGVAAAVGNERLTRTGTVVGTPFYAAPEQLRGERGPGPPADVWGLGVILYEALCGQLPFQGETMAELVLQVTTRRPQPPRRVAPDVPPPLEAICLRALATPPQERYPHGEALADDLEAWLRGERVSTSAPRGGAAGSGLWRAAGYGSALTLAAALPLALLWTTPAPPPPGRSPPPAPPGPGTATPLPDPGAARRLAALRLLTDPQERAQAAASWLADYPRDPAAEQVRALRDEAARRAPLRRFRHGEAEARCVWVGPREALSWGLDGRLVLWDLSGEAPRELRSWSPCGGRGLLAVAVQGRRALVGAHQDELAWVDLERSAELSLRAVRPLPRLFEVGGVESVAMWRQGGGLDRWLIGTATRGVWLYESDPSAETPGRAETLVPGEAPVRLVALTPDGRRAVVVSGDGRAHQGRVQVWELEGRRLVGEYPFLDTGGSLALSPDGRRYAVGTSLGRVLLGRIDEPAPQSELRATDQEPLFPGAPQIAHANRAVTGVAFSPDGRRLYSLAEGTPGVSPSELKVWDLEGEREQACLPIREVARGLSLSPDGTRLLVAIAGGELQEWRAPGE